MVESPEFWVAVAFVIFVAATFKPVKLALTGALDNRATTIRAQIDEARRLREEAQAALAEAQRKHRDAAGEAEALIASAKEEARLLQAQAAENLETTLARREQLAMERIAQAETAAVTQVRRIAADIAIAAAGTVLQAQLTGPAGDHLIDEAIADLPRKLQ